MKVLKPNRYKAVFIKSDIVHRPTYSQRGNAPTRHRCLNYTLRIESTAGKEIHTLPGGILMDNIQGPYASIIQFFRQIGWFRDPEDFNAKELEGHRVRVDTGITCDKKLGIRPYVIRFHPLKTDDPENETRDNK